MIFLKQSTNLPSFSIVSCILYPIPRLHLRVVHTLLHLAQACHHTPEQTYLALDARQSDMDQRNGPTPKNGGDPWVSDGEGSTTPPVGCPLRKPRKPANARHVILRS